MAVSPTAGGSGTGPIVLAHPDHGGIEHVARRCAAQLAAEGTVVFDVAVAATGVPAMSALRAVRRNARLIRSADVVQVELGSGALATFWFGVWAGFLRGDLVVVSHDGAFLVRAPGAGLLAARPGWSDRVAYRVLSPLLDGALRGWVRARTRSWVVLSREAQASLASAGMAPVTVVQHGADPAAHDRSPATGTTAVLAGFLGPGKGLETLLAAWRLTAGESGLHLVIAGTAAPAHQEWLARQRAAFDALADPPRWLGFLDDEAFDRVIAEAAVVVLPYSVANPASGIAVRAAVHGRPIVGTRVRALADVVADGVTGLLVAPDDPTALAGALLRLAREPALRDRLGDAGAAAAGTRHTWAHHVEGLRHAYALRGLATRPGSPAPQGPRCVRAGDRPSV